MVKVTTVDASRIDSVVRTPKGHFLVATPDAIFDWDGVDHAERHELPVASFVMLDADGPLFVRGQPNGKNAVSLELWDSETVTKIASLKTPASWRDGEDTSNHSASFSSDHTHFLFLGCGPLSTDGDSTGCETCVYTLPKGDRVHCTKTPPLVRQGYVGSATLSPAGSYYVLDEHFIPTQMHASATGKQLFDFKSSYQSNSLGDRHFAFTEDDRFVTASEDGKTVRVVELPSQAPVASVNYEKSKSAVYDHGHRISPSKAYVATLMTVGGHPQVEIWNIERKSASSYSVDGCTSCVLQWRDDKTLAMFDSGNPPSAEQRLDVETGTSKTVPHERFAADPLPGGDRLRFDTKSAHLESKSGSVTELQISK